jgi:hypothetical protein
VAYWREREVKKPHVPYKKPTTKIITFEDCSPLEFSDENGETTVFK